MSVTSLNLSGKHLALRAALRMFVRRVIASFGSCFMIVLLITLLSGQVFFVDLIMLFIWSVEISDVKKLLNSLFLAFSLGVSLCKLLLRYSLTCVFVVTSPYGSSASEKTCVQCRL